MTRRPAKSRRTACPICSAPRQQPGLPPTVPFGIPTYWSPDEALAIFEFISEMRDVIDAIYGASIVDAAREQRRGRPAKPHEPGQP
jgi:hypothetical protein